MSSTPMIRIENLSKVYGATHAVRGISFEVPRGQVVGFLGPNGAGKSTTMKILTGYVPATDGSARVAGDEVSEAPIETRTRIGYLPESNPLYDDMMVWDYLMWIAEVRKVAKSERPERLKSVIASCGLEAVVTRKIAELSKGYRQRVGLAQAILHDPDLLILDEPTTGLDPNQILEIRELIKELGKEKTVLMSSHIMQEIQATCSRVIIINNGEIVADGPTETLTKQGASIEITCALREGSALDAAGVQKALLGAAGVSDLLPLDALEPDTFRFEVHLKAGDLDPRRALFDCAVDAGFYLLGMEQKKVSLEDTFRELTANKEAA